MNDERTGLALPPGVLAPVPIDLDAVTLARAGGASVGKKVSMAVAGLVWCLFVLAHLLGNLTLFAGQEAYNGYSAKLMSLGPILIVLEAGLVLFLLLHVIFGIVVTLQNWKARPIGYAVSAKKGGRGVASSTMIYTGVLILFFMVLHLIHFKYGQHAMVKGKVDLYTSVLLLFGQPVYVVGYGIAVILVGLHVSHALQSSLRTLGWNSERSYPTVDRVSRLLGLVVALGYLSIPLYVLLAKGGA